MTNGNLEKGDKCFVWIKGEKGEGSPGIIKAKKNYPIGITKYQVRHKDGRKSLLWWPEEFVYPTDEYHAQYGELQPVL